MLLKQKIQNYLYHQEQQGLLRQRSLSNRQLLHFDSNDYLSLTQEQDIAQAYQRGYSLYPSGSGASMLLSGYHENHQAVEKAFAEQLNVDECILFSSGYAANLAITALIGKIDAHCLIDKEVHASIYDGLALAKARFTRYFHNDVDDLQGKLEQCSIDSIVFTEGIFSMSGQIAALSAIATLCRIRHLPMLVDEAHSFGVLGAQGKGSVVAHGLTQEDVPLRVIPLGKAFAAQGAIIAGQQEWVHALLQAGRSLIYSTAVSPAFSYGLLHTLERVIAADERREHLTNLIALFRDLRKQSPFNWADSLTPIQQLRLGCPHKALFYSHELQKEGISCFPLRQPTVGKKETGLRIILNYQHTPEHLNTLFTKLNKIYEHTH